MNARFLIATAAVLALISLLGCAQKMTITPMGVTDTPEYNYNIGMKHLKAGELEKALASFERAKGLDTKYAPAYEGIGLVKLAQGDLESAMKSFEKSADKDDEYAPAYIGMGRVYLAENKTKSARKKFLKARDVDPENADAYYYMGVSYMQERKFNDAERWFYQALEKNPAHADADTMWEKADKIKRAAPGTKHGEEICLKDTISRADFCALLIEELKLDKNRMMTRGKTKEEPESRRNIPDLVDISGHWAEKYIRTVEEMGVIMQFPDHTFRPDEPMRRVDLAIAVQNILTVATDEEELKTKFVGSPSPFPDVPSGSYGYNPILLASTRGILSAAVKTGEFRPNDPVPGADALIALRKLMTVLAQ